MQSKEQHLPVQKVALEAEQRTVLRVTLAQSNNPQCDESRQLLLPVFLPASHTHANVSLHGEIRCWRCSHTLAT